MSNNLEHKTPNCTCTGKKCTACKNVLCIGHFSFQSRKAGRLKPTCQKCDSVKRKTYYAANKEEQSKKAKQYYQAHSEQLKTYTRDYKATHPDYHKEYYQRNKDKVYAHTKAYRASNRQHYREWQTQYRRKRGIKQKPIFANDEERKHHYRQYHHAHYMRHREHYAEMVRTYRENNQPAIQQTKKRYYERNKGLFKVYKALRYSRASKTGLTFTKHQWEDLKAHYGNTCLCCKRCEPDVKLTPDHVVPLVKGGNNSIDNIQPLCLQCNHRKHTKIIDYRPA